MNRELLIMEQAVKAAGRIIVRRAKKIGTVGQKLDSSFVTDVDKESETTIINILDRAFPDYSIYSEEKGWAKKKSAELYFIVDPLDGTHNYICGYRQYGTSITLMQKKEPVSSVTYLPYSPFETERSDLLITAEKGRGVFENGRRIYTSKELSLEKAFLILGMNMEPEIYQKLKRTRENPNGFMMVRIPAAASVVYAGIARGSFSGFVVTDQKKYDLAQGLLYIPEAGGKITDGYGEPCTLDTNFVVASNGLIHEHLLGLLGKK